MKKLQLLIITFLISLSICAFVNMQAKADTGDANHLVVSSVTSQVAGTPFTVTVTAYNVGNSVATGYTDTVHFTSSDAKAVLPLDYTFLPTDNATQTFSVTLKTAGSQSVIATDTVTSSITGTVPLTVNAGVLDHFVFNTVASQTAGSAFGVTINAKDSNDNTVTSYTGTNTLTVSSGTINPTGTTAFALGVWTGQVTLPQSGTGISISTSGGGKSGTSSSFTVNAGAASKFVFAAIGAQTAGTAFNVVITVQDANGNAVTSYTGNPTLTYSAGTISPTTSGAFVSGTKTASVTVTTAGTGVMITATDGSITGTSGTFNVNAGSVSKFVFAAIGAQTAGTAFSITMTAQDTNGNTVTTYSGNPALTCSAGAGTISPTSSGAFASGTKNVQVTVTKSGSFTITAADGSTTGTSNTFIVNPAGLDHFDFTLISSPQVAGTGFSITITAKDSGGNTVASYTGTNTLAVSLGTISPTGTAAFTAGVWTGSVTLTQAGTGITISTSGGGKSGTSSSFTVNAGAASKFVFAAIGAQTAGTAFNVVITVQDANGNAVTSYTGNPTLTYSAGTISPTTSGAFVSGTKTASVTVTTAGTGVMITATDGSITGTSGTFNVNAGVAAHLVVSSGTSQVAGTPFSITVTAKDANGNTATSYIGTVHFSSSDSGVSVSLPNNYVFQSGDLGNHTFTNGVTLMTIGNQSVTVTDTVASSITGSQTGITVKVSSGIHFVVTGFPTLATAGSAGSVNVTVKDQYGNLFSGYAGTVKITSSDSLAVLPANAALTNGVGSFAVTLKTAGSQSITATDTVTSAINGSQTAITVNHAAAVVKIVISPSGSSVVAGASKTFSALASDVYGNSWDVTSLTSWSISSGAGGSWNSNVFTSAAVGSWIVTGTFASTAHTTGLTVNPAGLDHFVFSFVGDQSAGSAFTVTVMAKDKYENNVTGYIGTPSLAVSAGSISPSIMNAFVNGVGSTLVTVNTAGSGVNITATDGSVSGVSNSFAVTNSPTSTPTPAPNSTPTPTPLAKSTPTPTPTAKPSPSPTPLASVPVKTDSGSTIEFAIKGNITTSQISNATITSNQSNSTTTLSFTITGPNATTGFSNMTIPKTTIPYGTTPLISIDGQQAPNQGYTQDANNFYVWYTTQFSTHQVTIQFVASSISQSTFGPMLAVALTVPEIILLYIIIAVSRLKRKPENA